MEGILSKAHNRKVSIIGAGFVGASIAYSLMMRNSADTIILIDSNPDKSAAEVLDIKHGLPFTKCADIHCGQFPDIADSGLVIVTCGRNRKANESRLDMTNDNLIIAEAVASEIKKYYNMGVVLIISNPVDIITYRMTDWLKLPNGKVFGSGCMLDVSRFVSVLSDYLRVYPHSINACIIGEHGNSHVALWSKTTVEGISIDDYCSRNNVPFDSSIKRRIEQQVINMGSAIIEGKGRTHYGIAACVCYIADSILNGYDITACVSVALDGEYGLSNIALSLPCIINQNGVSPISDYCISDTEYEKLHSSAAKIKAVTKFPFGLPGKDDKSDE